MTINELIKEKQRLLRDCETMDKYGGSANADLSANQQMQDNAQLSEAEKELNIQEIKIDQLLADIGKLEGENKDLEIRNVKANSGKLLPPMQHHQPMGMDEEVYEEHHQQSIHQEVHEQQYMNSYQNQEAT